MTVNSRRFKRARVLDNPLCDSTPEGGGAEAPFLLLRWWPAPHLLSLTMEPRDFISGEKELQRLMIMSSDLCSVWERGDSFDVCSEALTHSPALNKDEVKQGLVFT